MMQGLIGHCPGILAVGAIIPMELHEIETAKRGSVLILLATGEREVPSLDLIREVSDFVFAECQAEILCKRCYKRNHQDR